MFLRVIKVLFGLGKFFSIPPGDATANLLNVPLPSTQQTTATSQASLLMRRGTSGAKRAEAVSHGHHEGGLIKEGFGYRIHNTVLSMVFIWPSMLLGMTGKHLFAAMRKRCGCHPFSRMPLLQSQTEDEASGNDSFSETPNPGFGEDKDVAYLYVLTPPASPASRFQRGDGDGLGASQKKKIRPLPCPLHCTAREVLCTTDSLTASVPSGPRAKRTESQSCIPSCRCISCQLREADLRDAGLHLVGGVGDVDVLTFREIYAEGLHAPRAFEAGTWHELFVSWVKTVISLFWITCDSALCLKNLRFWTDFSLASSPVIRQILLRDLVNPCFRAVRKTDVYGQARERGWWSYLLWPRERATGPACQKGNPQMLDWNAVFLDGRGQQVGGRKGAGSGEQERL